MLFGWTVSRDEPGPGNDLCRCSASTAVVGVIVGEWIGSQTGIGALIIQATDNFDSALRYVTVICGSAFSVLFFLSVRLLERICVR